MARLQILELPSGINDERPPFALIVDQATEATAKALDIVGQSTASLIQARTVLVFDETVEIPANDTSAYVRESGEWSTMDELRAVVQEEIAKAQAELVDTLNMQARP
ncbi:hypothetical protein OG601_47410 [Streptomyces sp. NBC_01239]|uniref:hypothetical protein n=1 Tax=Streptomyces sp. NBC_01239 TaxID=2903792 RepID=UPI0022537F0A|nr:hypothetical protein [Streptomyces sp. NBC_01239]MCX4816756.1 hypothetical protein [Streptomyces sp. NBC_01239]MCX4818204.1 hypothetical protein [Streptomyces sp. NBC_01239]